jgi:hypothetical protein
MRSVRLSWAHRAYLLRAEYLPEGLRRVVTRESAETQRSGAITLEVDSELAERFRSAFTERLAKVGFGPNYELSGEGAMLEELIDLFLGEPAS